MVSYPYEYTWFLIATSCVMTREVAFLLPNSHLNEFSGVSNGSITSLNVNEFLFEPSDYFKGIDFHLLEHWDAEVNVPEMTSERFFIFNNY